MSIHTIDAKSNLEVPQQNETATDPAERNWPTSLDLRVLAIKEKPDSPLSPSSSTSRHANDGSPSYAATPRRPYVWQKNGQFPSAHPGTPSCLSESSQTEEKDQVDEGNLYENDLFASEVPSTITRCRSAPPVTETRSADSGNFLSLTELSLNNISSGTRSAN